MTPYQRRRGKRTKAQAGQIGGRVTFARHGRDHMARIGKRGARVTWSRYSLKPVNQSQYAMVERETGKIVKIIGA